MPHVSEVARWSYPVTPVRLFLVEAYFVDNAGPFEDPVSETAPDDEIARLSLQVFRPAPLRLTVVLGFESSENEPVQIVSSYAAEFEMSQVVPEADREREWRHIALHVAPGLLYPYLRETVTTLAARGRGRRRLLPLVPLPLTFYDDESFEIPPPPSDTEQLDLPTVAAPPPV